MIQRVRSDIGADVVKSSKQNLIDMDITGDMLKLAYKKVIESYSFVKWVLEALPKVKENLVANYACVHYMRILSDVISEYHSYVSCIKCMATMKDKCGYCSEMGHRFEQRPNILSISQKKFTIIKQLPIAVS